MLECHVSQVEVNALEQQIGGNKRLFLAIREHRGIVAYAKLGGAVHRRHVFGEVFNKPEFAKC